MDIRSKASNATTHFSAEKYTRLMYTKNMSSITEYNNDDRLTTTTPLVLQNIIERLNLGDQAILGQTNRAMRNVTPSFDDFSKPLFELMEFVIDKTMKMAIDHELNENVYSTEFQFQLPGRTTTIPFINMTFDTMNRKFIFECYHHVRPYIGNIDDFQDTNNRTSIKTEYTADICSYSKHISNPEITRFRTCVKRTNENGKPNENYYNDAELPTDKTFEIGEKDYKTEDHKKIYMMFIIHRELQLLANIVTSKEIIKPTIVNTTTYKTFNGWHEDPSHTVEHPAIDAQSMRMLTSLQTHFESLWNHAKPKLPAGGQTKKKSSLINTKTTVTFNNVTRNVFLMGKKKRVKYDNQIISLVDFEKQTKTRRNKSMPKS